MLANPSRRPQESCSCEREQTTPSTCRETQIARAGGGCRKSRWRREDPQSNTLLTGDVVHQHQVFCLCCLYVPCLSFRERVSWFCPNMIHFVASFCRSAASIDHPLRPILLWNRSVEKKNAWWVEIQHYKLQLATIHQACLSL